MIRKPNLQLPIYGKIPPQAPDLEVAVLGACMLERETFESVMEVIPGPECFYVDAHQKIYEAMCVLYNSGGMVDLLTIGEQLRKLNTLEIVGGMYALDKISQAVMGTAHVVNHARIVMEKFMLRECIRIGMGLANDAYSGESDVFDLLDRSENELKAVTDGIISGSDTPVGVTYAKMLQQMEKQRELKTDIIGIRSGYDELDRLTLGWQKTDLIILAARPSQGKTALAVNLAVNAQKPTLIFSLESTDVPLVRRMAAAKNNIPLKDIRRGCFDIDQRDKMVAAQFEFNKLPIRIDSKSRSLSTIKKVCRKWSKRMRKQGAMDLLIIIDYLQLMSLSGKGSREQEIASISRDLKELATELELPIIALSQLNRETEKTGNKKPALSNLRESGSLEQDANMVMFIWWEDTGDRNQAGEPVLKTWLLLEKNRDGECGAVELKFNGDIQKWLNAEDINYGRNPSFIDNNFKVSSQDRKDEDTPF